MDCVNDYICMKNIDEITSKRDKLENENIAPMCEINVGNFNKIIFKSKSQTGFCT